MKHVFLICIFFLWTGSINAQVKRNVGGVVLGKTTKKEVSSHLRSKKLLPQEKADGKALVGVGEISFGGVIWQGVKYYFYNDVVYKVVFINQYTGSVYDLHKYDETYKKIRNDLLRKYTNKPLPSQNTKIPDNLYLKGKEVSIEIKRERQRGNRIIGLTYTDIVLDRKSKNKDFDDL
jgi:hypothetical protein